MKIMHGMTTHDRRASIPDLLDGIASGRIRVPSTAPPFCWSPDQVLALLDSIARGYPAGAITTWAAGSEPVPCRASLAGRALPPGGPQDRAEYLLDGHQRLAALLGVLTAPDPGTGAAAEDWQWDVRADLTRPGPAPRLLHGRDCPPGDHRFFPFRAALRTMDFLAWEHQVRQAAGDGAEDAVDAASGLAMRVMQFSFPLLTLAGGAPDDARTVAARLNPGRG